MTQVSADILKDDWPANTVDTGFLRGGTAILGNFDGLHPGHRAVIELGMRGPKPHYLLSFAPYPREFFNPDQKIRLTSLEQKARILASFGLNHLVILPFTADLSMLAADDFVQEILYKKLGVRQLVVGSDFRFGHKRQGDVQLLDQMGGQYHFDTIQCPILCDGEDKKYSSSEIRKNLSEGQVENIFDLMGRFFEIENVVSHGDHRGRDLGFPTANIDSGAFFQPRKGVYKVNVHIDDHQNYCGIANFGTRPTIDGKSLWLETHLFDFSGDLYGKKIRVVFRKFIRPEKKFPSLDMLKQQIAEDIKAVRINQVKA